MAEHNRVICNSRSRPLPVTVTSSRNLFDACRGSPVEEAWTRILPDRRSGIPTVAASATCAAQIGL
jgi:hypothetical protein